MQENLPTEEMTEEEKAQPELPIQPEPPLEPQTEEVATDPNGETPEKTTDAPETDLDQTV